MNSRTKILTQREAFDGTTRCPPKDLDSLKFVDDRTDTTEGSHEVFGEKYKSEEYNRVPQEFQNVLYSTSILGWTQKDGKVFLVSPHDNRDNFPELGTQAQHYRQNIFPVITQWEEVPIESINWDEIKEIYEKGHYLVLSGTEKNIPQANVMLNGKPQTLKTLEGSLYYIAWSEYKRATDKKDYIINRVHRILDPIDNIDCDYPVFGMYAGGRLDMTPPMKFSVPKKKRLCFDQSIDTQSTSDFSFRTEISYNWRSRRVGYYCSRNALLFVTEYDTGFQASEVLHSLLRESTFVVADGTHIYKRSQINWNYQIRDKDPTLILEPMIAIATEGLSKLNVTSNHISLEFRELYYTLENGFSRPLLLNWTDFENDWNPIGANIPSFVSQQHRFNKIMKKNEFFDYLLFPNILFHEILDERTDLLFAMNSSVTFVQQFNCYTSWLCYGSFEIVDNTQYYHFLGSFGLRSHMNYCDFRDPHIFSDPWIFEGKTIDLNGFPELHQRKTELTRVIQRMFIWYKMEVLEFRSSSLYNNCIRKLKYIFQLRNPTVNSELRFGKIQSVWKQLKPSKHSKDMFRRFHQRFWQIVKRKDMQDFITIHHSSYYALVMAELPDPINETYKGLTQMIEIWDVYEYIKSDPNATKDDENDLFKFLVSVKFSFRYDNRFTSQNCVIERQEFPIEMENTIDRRWYPLELNPLTADHMVEYSPQISEQNWQTLCHDLQKEARTILHKKRLEKETFWSDIRRRFIKNYPDHLDFGTRRISYHQILDEVRNPPQLQS